MQSSRRAGLVFAICYAGMLLVDLRIGAATVLLFLPILYLSSSAKKTLAVVAGCLALKMALSLWVPAGPDYTPYAFQLSWFVREPATILVFFVWFLAGRDIYPADMLARIPWPYFLAAFACSLAVNLVRGLPNLAGVESPQIIVQGLALLYITSRSQSLSRACIGVALMIAWMGVPQSSFTVISVGVTVLALLVRILGWDRVQVRWRRSVLIVVVFLIFASLIAPLVHLRGDKVNGEGNNGVTRQLLAARALIVVTEHVPFGTNYGRGIVPYNVIRFDLGWEEYFDEGAGTNYDPYPLSFHNGFLYLISRYGILCVVWFWLILRHAPARGPLALVLFTMVMCLAISANVVIESVRAGPGVALLLGALFSTGAGVPERRARDLAPEPHELIEGS